MNDHRRLGRERISLAIDGRISIEGERRWRRLQRRLSSARLIGCAAYLSWTARHGRRRRPPDRRHSGHRQITAPVATRICDAVPLRQSANIIRLDYQLNERGVASLYVASRLSTSSSPLSTSRRPAAALQSRLFCADVQLLRLARMTFEIYRERPCPRIICGKIFMKIRSDFPEMWAKLWEMPYFAVLKKILQKFLHLHPDVDDFRHLTGTSLSKYRPISTGASIPQQP